MSKNYKIALIVGVVVLLVVAVIAVLYQAGKKSPGDQTGSGTVPDYTLDATTEKIIREVAVNFASLYNTYTGIDFSNVTSMGDFQTVGMQNDTVEYVENLKANTQEKYSIRTTAEDSSFQYRYPIADKVYVTLNAAVDERIVQSDGSIVPRQYPVAVTMELNNVSGRWLVNSISYKK
jgi:hypothetical protein